MKNVIVGTAGHIDHGKTSLVRALTGIDTDRLAEEKRRGISIDLGFAHFNLNHNLRIALVDVPGHERFIRNMLAGVGGIDLVLFVVACDESIKPQTREHLDICRLLRIDRGLIALTKADTVDAEIQELVRLEVEELVAGTFLEGAPIVPVSVVSGAGLDALRAALSEVASSISERACDGFARMPVDRSFVAPGFGTVVTGTLIAGVVSVEDELQVYPSDRMVRVRGLQVHGERVPVARAGQRVAINLAGAEVSQLSRGVVLGAAGMFESTRLIDAMLEVLPAATVLKSRSPIRIHSGTAEVIGEIRTSGEIRPGSLQPVRIALRDPLLLLPGDRFIARRFSPVVTIGGGTVIDASPPRKFSSMRVQALNSGNLALRLLTWVEETDHGASLVDLVRRTGLRAACLLDAAESLVILGESEPWLMSDRQVRKLSHALTLGLTVYHEQEPLSPGQSRELLRAECCRSLSISVFDALLVRESRIVAEGEHLRLASHRILLRNGEDQALAKIERIFAGAGLAAPSLEEALAASGLEARRANALAQILLRDQKLLRISQHLVFHAEAVVQLRQKLRAWGKPTISVSEFKDLTGVSRKYAIPLLEFFDRERTTRRSGDLRLIL